MNSAQGRIDDGEPVKPWTKRMPISFVEPFPIAEKSSK
jgi:hypothetical protein